MFRCLRTDRLLNPLSNMDESDFTVNLHHISISVLDGGKVRQVTSTWSWLSAEEAYYMGHKQTVNI